MNRLGLSLFTRQEMPHFKVLRFGWKSADGTEKAVEMAVLLDWNCDAMATMFRQFSEALREKAREEYAARKI